MPRRWRSPPERLTPRSPTRVSSPRGKRSWSSRNAPRWAARAAASIASWPLPGVRRRYSPSPNLRRCDVLAHLEDAAADGGAAEHLDIGPVQETRPPVGSKSRARAVRGSSLPAPLGPTSAIMAPAGMRSESR